MSMTYAMVLDGVLRRENGSILEEGRVLYQALSEVARVALLVDDEDAKVEHFLGVNRLTRHAQIVPERFDKFSTRVSRRIDQITRLRGSGSHVALVVEPDPEVASELLKNGVTTLLMMHAKYMQPSLRPDAPRNATPWAELVREVEYQEQMKVQDLRTEMSTDV